MELRLRWICLTLAISVQNVASTTYYMDDSGPDCNVALKHVDSEAIFVRAWRWVPRFFYGGCKMYFVSSNAQYNALWINFQDLSIQRDGDVTLTFYDGNSTDDYTKQLASFTYSDSRNIPSPIRTTGRYLTIALERAYNSVEYDFSMEIKPLYVPVEPHTGKSIVPIISAAVAVLLAVIICLVIAVACCYSKRKKSESDGLINGSTNGSVTDYNSVNSDHLSHFPPYVEAPPPYAPLYNPNMPTAPSQSGQGQGQGYLTSGPPSDHFQGYPTTAYPKDGAAAVANQPHWSHEKSSIPSTAVPPYYGPTGNLGYFEHAQPYAGGYAPVSDMGGYAPTPDMGGYAPTLDMGGYAPTPDMGVPYAPSCHGVPPTYYP